MFSYSHCALGRTDLSTSAALWSTAIAKKWIWQHEGKQKAFGRQIAFLDCAASGRQRRADGMTASDEEEVKRNNKNRSHKQFGHSAGDAQPPAALPISDFLGKASVQSSRRCATASVDVDRWRAPRQLTTTTMRMRMTGAHVQLWRRKKNAVPALFTSAKVNF